MTTSWTSRISTLPDARAGPMKSLNGPRKDLSALFDLIVRHVPPPRQQKHAEEDFSMLATTLGADPFIGRILTGRVETGRLKTGQTIQALSRIGQKIEQFRVSKIMAFRGLGQQPIDEAVAGDIVTIAGMSKATVSDTLCALAVDTALPAQPIDPPTISVTFGINDSPLAGRDGKKVQSRVIRDRLMKEAETNVAIKISDTPGGEAFEVAGRGELADGRPDREHAPRGVRTVDLTATGPVPRYRRRAARTDRGSHDRRR